MTYLYGSTLVVITLLQLCRAQTSDAPPDWYSANVINDGFQPKPISELFATEATFSSTNPIIILPKTSSTDGETAFVSTLPPSTFKVSSSGATGDLTDFVSIISSTPTPIFSPEDQTQPQTVQEQRETPSLEPIQTFGTTPRPLSSVSTVEPFFSTQAVPSESVLPSREQSQTQSRSSQTQNQQVRLEIVPQNQPINSPFSVLPMSFTQPPNFQPSSVTPPPNYFLIYQQAPQNIQNYPQQPPVPVVSVQNPPSTVSTTILPPITRPMPQVTVQTIPSKLPRTLPSSTPKTLPTTKLVPSTARRNVTRPGCRTSSTCRPRLSTTNRVPKPSFPFTLRVIAPSGSLTKVRINPTTTTRKPTTKRTPKPKGNRYEVCINSCKGKKEPICGAPIADRHINPKRLKGFPSVCHMACHNSFKKDTYEKIVDGKCGKLRSKIRIVENNKKLTKPELKKTEYVVINSNPKTVVEFSGNI